VKTVKVTSLRSNLSETLKRVASRRETILIERRGKAIAALVPKQSLAKSTTRRARSKSARVAIDPREVADFCERHQIKTLSLFGSILTDKFDAHSDVDVMFEPQGSTPGYFEQMDMADELEKIFGRPVDLVSKRAVEASTNRFRKRAILEGARIIHGR
jgi:uncharacterized protein